MSNFIAKDIYKMTNENNDLIISFVINKDNRYSAEFGFKELKELEKGSKIKITAVKYKSKRSLEQNRMLWALIEKIALMQTGYSRKEDVEECYCNLIEEANIVNTYDWIPALESSKKNLEAIYRVVKNYGERIIINPKTKKETECVLFKCYKGSSHFNTKEMTELIDLALDTLADLGVSDNEIMLIKEEYRC